MSPESQTRDRIQSQILEKKESRKRSLDKSPDAFSDPKTGDYGPFTGKDSTAKNKDAVKEILSQVFSSLGDGGQKYLKQALKELLYEV